MGQALPLEDRDAVGDVQIVANRLGSGEGAVRIGAGDQLVDQVSTQSQLDLGDGPLVRELKLHRGGGVLESEHLRRPDPPIGVDQGQHAEDVVARLDGGHDPAAVTHRPTLACRLT